MHFEITAPHDCPTFFDRIDFHGPDSDTAKKWAKAFTNFLGTSLILNDPSLVVEGKMSTLIEYDSATPSPTRKLGITRDHQ